MTTQAFRSAVFSLLDGHLSANHPGVFVMWENGPEVDEASVGDLFVDVELRFYGAQLIEVGQGGRGRHSGAISVDVYAKQATGTASGDEIVDGLVSLLKSKRLAGGITTMPQRKVPNPAKGWHRTGVLVPFLLNE